ncbi:ral guanine nucleotide dissociation stimulator-like isoform X4 [Diceros bicornis minor]|uniref:ral guanine nucleotide dissociation stimulator-like isoform X4 n=2 Tax=Diceros bicornis minor TaxID=77932 RepID=UPI0026F1413F|nr:ral guanine nucleotide dissociation stimulator-like isoform X4 [Diceros bicornis minor]
MDAELFRKVVPSQCLGSTWGKRNKPSNEHLAHTVRATIDHFRRVASLVVTTCLGDPSMMAQDRECKILKNFSSPRTVISVLQKTSICHLKNTWGKFPGGESSEKLKERYSQDESLSRELMTKEGPSTFAPPESNPQRVQEKQQQRQGNGINLEKSTEEQLWHSLQGRGRRWKSETFWAEQSLASPAVSYIEWKSLIPEKWETHPIGGYTLSCQPER